jgi:hypothetical protein
MQRRRLLALDLSFLQSLLDIVCLSREVLDLALCLLRFLLCFLLVAQRFVDASFGVRDPFFAL